MRILLDTNVHISSIFWRGNSREIINLCIDKNIDIFITEHIFFEIRKVLIRDFKIDEQEVLENTNKIKEFTTLIIPTEKISYIKEDPDDDKILEGAVEAKVDFIATQDTNLLKLKDFRKIKIIKPDEFLKLF